jgi:hypothetical protein
MSEVTIDLFAEDRAHEFFVIPLLERIAEDEGRRARVNPISVRGGHPRVQKELDLYLNVFPKRSPDLVVVCVDGNCKKSPVARAEIERRLPADVAARAVVACPDPHIERWYLADPTSFEMVVGFRPQIPKRKCERGRYKRLLADAVAKAGEVSALGGIEYGRELVAAMDLFRAAKSDSSLRAFIGDARRAVRTA